VGVGCGGKLDVHCRLDLLYAKGGGKRRKVEKNHRNESSAQLRGNATSQRDDRLSRRTWGLTGRSKRGMVRDKTAG